MAYEETCPEGGSYSRIPYYSNPDVYYEGYATGTAEANNALEMTVNKYGYSTAGPNCADGMATDKTDVINQCTWGDDWNEQPTTQCCCEGNLYAAWYKYHSSPVCAMDVPGYTHTNVDYGHKMGVKLKDCKNLLGELITPYNTCALGKTINFRGF